ncbi:MAG: FtsW/RodA/SpoVE family cell cycle protein, partial [Clostridia bacterium]|nr:FtsW/RodA/SpoVE family cell cycle protein [Clostridia bacterium]
LSCTILLFCMGVSMMWLGGVKKKWFALLGVAAALLIGYVVFINPEFVKSFSTYAYERIMTWKLGEDYGNTTRWQTEQGLLAIGSGGPFGVGFGNSKQKQLYIPEPQNDFIFSVVCEELGFVGAAIVILLFAALICRGFMIATKSKDLFGALLVIGVMMQLGFQVILNIAVVTDTIPNTGIALPFFSYGGTALVILLCEMGVVLSVSRRCRLEN